MSMIFPKSSQVLAFVLPQYHPIPENDEWWGKGFTEWRPVSKGRPLFRNHYQPHIPSELGFYDLRVPEVREQQAALARKAGLNGFVYYHYWFGGRRLLERPVNDILRMGEPAFPFCLCWANESWSRNWDGNSKSILFPQVYSPADDVEHIKWLCRAFEDQRYIKIGGCPLFIVYRPSNVPNMRETAEKWRSAAVQHGFPGLFLCGVQAFVDDIHEPIEFGLDAAIEFKPNCTDPGPTLRSTDPIEIGYQLHRVWTYDSLVNKCLENQLPAYKLFPGICPSWDNSVRRRIGGTIFKDATPDKYRDWLFELLVREPIRPQRESIIFVNAWNEWAEGNHLEPCERWGDGYIEATSQAIRDAQAVVSTLESFKVGMKVVVSPHYEIIGNVDSRQNGTFETQLAGWTINAKDKRPPDLLALAARQADGVFVLLSRVEAQRVPRSDVASEHGAASILSGWTASYRREHGQVAPNEVVVLAFRASDRAVGFIAPLVD